MSTDPYFHRTIFVLYEYFMNLSEVYQGTQRCSNRRIGFSMKYSLLHLIEINPSNVVSTDADTPYDIFLT